MLRWLTGILDMNKGHTGGHGQKRRERKEARARRASRKMAVERLEDRTLLSTTPTGAVTSFTRDLISGWAFNGDDGSGAVTIEITINGEKTTLSADDNVPSLSTTTGGGGAPYHGFSFTPPELAPGSAKVLIQAVSATTGKRKTLKSGTLKNPAPVGSVTLNADGTELTGWAYDPDSAEPLNIRIDIDGVEGTPFATDVARPDIAKRFHTATNLWGFDVTSGFAGHVVEVYAIDAPTDTPVLIYSNNKKAVGKVEVNNGFVVSGWTYDPNNPSASISVKVTIDGVRLAGTPTVANGERPDLVSTVGSANHGFNISIPGLTPGKHTIAVWAFDGQAGAAMPVLLGSKVVNNAPPTGRVDALSSTSISGWALDPDLGTSPSQINVYVDDSLFGTFAASENRPNLSGAKQNHGFTVDISSLPEGSHSITVTVTDNRTSDENEVVIFDDFINNHVPVGSFDGVTGTTIYGWAYDPDALSMGIPVDIYVDGVYQDTVTADEAREDLDGTLPSPHHAFTADLPTLSFGTHRIDLYAAESQGNVSVLIGSRTISNSRPIGSLETANASYVSGWAADPDQLGESIQVQVYVNGELATSATANIQRNDLLAVPPFSTSGTSYSNYGYSVELTGLSAGDNYVDVYAIDKNNGLKTWLGTRVVTVLQS